MISEARIDWTEDEGSFRIMCLRCDMTSYNPNDVAYRYCGWCHEFHDDWYFHQVANREESRPQT